MNFFLGNTYLFFIFLISFFIYLNKFESSSFLPKYLAFVFIMLMGNAIWYLRFDTNNYISLLFRILTAYIILKLLKDKFVYTYVKIIYFICIVGLFFWLLFVLFPAVEKFFIYNITPHFNFYDYEYGTDDDHARPAPHFLIYTMNFGETGLLFSDADYISSLSGINRFLMRNSLCFTEPSVAMLFVIPALFFNLILKNKFFTRENVIFIISIFTSMSTGGLAVLSFLVSGWLITNKDISKLKPFIIPIALVLSYISFIYIDSFGKEIMEEFSYLKDGNIKNQARTRFVSGYLDFEESFSHPLFGKGFKSYVNWTYEEHRNNGTTFLLNRYGYITFFLYFFLIFKYFKYLCLKHSVNVKFSIIMIFSLILIGFGNKNFEKPFFIGLTLIYFINRESNIKILPKLNNI